MGYLLMIPFFLAYLVTLYLINKQKATSMIKTLMTFAKDNLDTGAIKKEFVKETAKEIILNSLHVLPFEQTVK